MGTVIHVDFTKDKQNENATQSNKRTDFLVKCRFVLDENDYLELLEAIADPESYLQVDDEIKDIADAYLDLR